MARQESDDAFDNAMDGFRDSFRESLTPELRELIGRRLGEQRTQTAHPAATLKMLSKFVKLSRHSCSAETKKHIGNAILDGSNPVDIFFGCLPDPTEHESIQTGSGSHDFVTTYRQAHEALETFGDIHGRKHLTRKYKDFLHKRLFKAMARANAFRSAGGPITQSRVYRVMFEDLLRLAWEIPRELDTWQKYSDRTASFVEYLHWTVQGRKDTFCTFKKPWSTIDPGQLRENARLGLSCLYEDTLPKKCAGCSGRGAKIRCVCCGPGMDNSYGTMELYCSEACRAKDQDRHEVSRQETVHLHRLALLFQAAFVQYLLSINHGDTYTVWYEEGIVKAIVSQSAPVGGSPEGAYEGVSPDLDLSQPGVETALHTLQCCAIKGPAQALLEHFFRSSCDKIEFLHFIPRNAHTPVDFNGCFNMAPNHTVAILTTTSGLEFILDSTAAQYGWKETLATREAYDRCRIDYEIDIEPCHPPESHHRERSPSPEDENYSRYWRASGVVEDTLRIVEEHVSAAGGLHGVIHLPEDCFKQQCLDLKQALKSGMEIRDRRRARLEGY